VCQRSRGDELLEQKGVSNILWLFYLLDKIDGQIGIVMRMEEQEEQMRLKEGQKGEDGPNDAEKEKNKKKKKKKKSKKANSNKAKQKEQKKEKQEQFDMYQRGGTRIEFLKVGPPDFTKAFVHKERGAHSRPLLGWPGNSHASENLLQAERASSGA